jgi:NadR type nicotinamide-nucleotide adenylyltransferase
MEKESYRHRMKKIVIIGPESTGKSTLCTELAEHYKTSWVPEYAREFLLKNGMNYTYEDLLHIARMQLQTEEEYARQNSSDTLFIDTDMYVMKVWCEFVFGKCHQWILDQIAERKYDLYLLCNNDLPWVKDELREYPDLESRQQLFHIYKDLMVNQHVPWKEIKGTASDRLASALDAVKYLLK